MRYDLYDIIYDALLTTKNWRPGRVASKQLFLKEEAQSSKKLFQKTFKNSDVHKISPEIEIRRSPAACSKISRTLNF